MKKMLVTLLWFEDIDVKIIMLLTFQSCWWFFQCKKSVTNIIFTILKLAIFRISSTSQNCHQHKSFPTSVTNIDRPNLLLKFPGFILIFSPFIQIVSIVLVVNAIFNIWIVQFTTIKLFVSHAIIDWTQQTVKDVETKSCQKMVKLKSLKSKLIIQCFAKIASDVRWDQGSVGRPDRPGTSQRKSNISDGIFYF